MHTVASSKTPSQNSLAIPPPATEAELDELISRPSAAVIQLMAELEGDLLFLGVAGKIGLSLARMAKRACVEAGVKKRLLGVARFSKPGDRDYLESYGIETLQGDLLERSFVAGLPSCANVIFLAGMKFGAQDNLAQTWAMNTLVPALVAEHCRSARIVAYSTGCVYPLVPVASGGSRESDPPLAIGEYAQSCLGRERMFEYGSLRYGTKTALIRLNYSVEMRYGVLVDIACKVRDRQPIDLTMGHFNVIWQGDMNAATLLALNECAAPARILNLTGPETLSVRECATAFGRLMHTDPIFTGEEAPTALLSNSSEAQRLFGPPQIKPAQIIAWTAHWLAHGGNLLNKPTHFQERDGQY